MKATAATEPGSSIKPNEDTYLTTADVALVVDGATARTDSGCSHGTAWYSRQLTAQINKRAGEPVPLQDVLAAAIEDVTALHSECDLSHPGSPSAVVSILRCRAGQVEWLVLGDTTLILDADDGIRVHSQGHDHIAEAEREAAKAFPIGHPERNGALVRMKHVENAQRNQPGGFWVASTNPRAAQHAQTGAVPATSARRALLLTDGAAALSDLYRAASAEGLLNLAGLLGPAAIIRQVRALEAADPNAVRYRRTKACDDATAVYCEFASPQQ